MVKDTFHCRSCLCVMTLVVNVCVHSAQSSVNDKHVSLAVMKKVKRKTKVFRLLYVLIVTCLSVSYLKLENSFHDSLKLVLTFEIP